MGGTSTVDQPTTLYCANHPTVETLLRCSKCGKPICTRCGIRTPVGIRCRECARLRRLPSYSLGLGHYLLAAVVALPASAVAGLVMQQVGFYLAFFLGAGAGGLIAEIVYRVTGGKRGKRLALLVCACIVVGALSWVVLWGVPLAVFAHGGALNWAGLVTLLRSVNVIYVVLAVGAAYVRLQ